MIVRTNPMLDVDSRRLALDFLLALIFTRKSTQSLWLGAFYLQLILASIIELTSIAALYAAAQVT
jgi:hypothetical protein